MALALFETNDLYRTVDAVGDIILLDDIKPIEYTYQYPTLILNPLLEYKPMSQVEYNNEFESKLGITREILCSTTNIVVAGGAAARPLYTHDKNTKTDVDIFIYGITDSKIFWLKVNELVSKIYRLNMAQNADNEITFKMKKGIVVIYVYNSRTNYYLEYQIILRMYHTISSIIHAFDIPSCCVAYDGYTTFTTTLGAYAHATQVNLINTKYRSTSFEHRIRKYLLRGFALALVGYNLERGYDKHMRTLRHNYMCIHVKSVEDNKILVHSIYPCCRNYRSEYNEIKPLRIPYDKLIVEIQSIEEYGIILKNYNKLIDFSEFYNCDVATIIKKYPSIVQDTVNTYYHKIMGTKLNNLKCIKLPKLVLNELIGHIITSNEIKIKDILLEQIIVNGKYIPEWIYIHDPTRQYTAAINPIIDSPEEWYGDGLYNEKV